MRVPHDPRWREGDVFWLYLISYGVARFIIEQLRTDSRYIGPFPAAFWVSAGLVSAGVIGLLARIRSEPHRSGPRKMGTPSHDSPRHA